MARKGVSPLELLVQQIEQNEQREASLQYELDSLPRWRFRRRLEAERRLKRRRKQGAMMQDMLERGGRHS
jgi:hypothetical protein